MESVLGRYRNLIVLVGVLFAQVLGLAVQVRRTTDSESTRLIRIWAVGAVTPLEKTLVWSQTSCGNIWHNYFYLRGVRAENRDLKQQIERMRLEQVRMSQDADQARRLQALLGFKEQFISQTMAAQVIGGSGTDLSRLVYIDKGYKDGIRSDMAVITADGVVGKVLRADPADRHVSQVLLINDQTSGVGALLDKTRLQGIVRGTPAGEVVLEKVMSDETVPAGEQVLTSGGDGVFPKGLLIGKVTKVSQGGELFLNIAVRPAADLSRLEEVLVVTKIDERQAQPDQKGAARAVDILAERLPGVPSKSESDGKGGAPGTSEPGVAMPGIAAPGAPKQSIAGSDAKPKAAPAQALAASGAPAAAKVAKPPSSSGPPSGAGTDATKVPPKPLKAAVEPKPQPAAAEDAPH
jgi:rod shape-determining protein MreC